MRFSFLSAVVVALAADATVASSWFGKAAYNEWHETELERWLSDHDVAYPTPADRKDLENLVKQNWDSKVSAPYSSWDTKQLQNYLSSKGHQVKKGTESNKDSLVGQVKSAWHETGDTASNSYDSVKDWIFDTWSESQLKAFLDYHGVPNPSPRTRDSLLKSARENYQSAANKIGETAAYPGDWLYESWSESDLKAWLDERGVPVPQGNSRNKLIASVRRNARLSGNKLASATDAAAASASSATQALSDKLLDSWSDSQIKEWADKNGIKVPQGSNRNELLALARKHSAKLASSDSSVANAATSMVGDAASSGSSMAGNAASSASSLVGNAASSASSMAGSATGKAGKAGASASSLDGAASSNAGNQYAQATDDAALKANQAYNAADSWFDWIKAQVGLGASKISASGTAYASSASASGKGYASDASASLASAAGRAGNSASSASGRAANSASSASGKVAKSASSASDYASKSGASDASYHGQKATDAAKESMSKASNRVGEAAQKATDYIKEEL
ncbi:hypothetical protein LTR39_001763 [Cryomyces antarcticus]|nr:hypothetical protein LTR39_001763 [Cryomyces antarcticus]